jgi:hypothetical protein
MHRLGTNKLLPLGHCALQQWEETQSRVVRARRMTHDACIMLAMIGR